MFFFYVFRASPDNHDAETLRNLANTWVLDPKRDQIDKMSQFGFVQEDKSLFLFLFQKLHLVFLLNQIYDKRI